MKSYSEKFINEIRKVRKTEKISYRQIGIRFKIPSSTIRNWCYGVVGCSNSPGEALIVNNENKRIEIIKSETFVVPNLNSINRNQAKFLAAILYGCEGFKYPASNYMGFSNSDIKLILTFYKLLTRAFNLDKKKFSLHLQIHTTHSYLKLRNIWSRLLGLPESCFIKPTITEPKGKKHRKNYLGTCTVRYRDYRIQLKLLGIFDRFTEKFKNTVVDEVLN